MSIWKTNEWKIRASAFVYGKKCSWCGSFHNLAPHHPRRKNGYTYLEYLSLEGCVVLCNKCHFMLHKGYRLCLYCKKKYYNPSEYECCFNCHENGYP